MRHFSPAALVAALLIGLLTPVYAQNAPATAAPAVKPPVPYAHPTLYPATAQPDEVVLTWAGNPANSISIQWRTSVAVSQGAVAYAPRSAANGFTPLKPTIVPAQFQPLFSASCVNDPFCNHFTAHLSRLKPDTDYVYAVGDGSAGGWGELRSFHTAPSRPEPFAFVYMGDAQFGFSRWAALQRAAMRQRPDARFFVMAGDQVDRGGARDDWDDLLVHASGVFSRVPVLPTVGNHELKPDGFPMMFEDLFDLPRNGPAEIDPKRAYALTYGNALFVVLDSNLPAASEAPWLEQQLASSQATWKFVMFHHPLYSSEPGQDHKDIRETWGPIFDKYHVDLVFEGHEHAYMRTFPLKGGKIMPSPADGTIYLISSSGTKLYKQIQADYMEVHFIDTPMYNVIDILPACDKAGDRLIFRGYDLEGNTKDQFTIDKNAPKSED